MLGLLGGGGRVDIPHNFFLSQHKDEDEDSADNAFRELGFVIIITY